MAEVPDEVIQHLDEALEHFHTTTSMDPEDASRDLTRLEDAWQALRPFVPPTS